jgi:hypothetical protein
MIVFLLIYIHSTPQHCLGWVDKTELITVNIAGFQSPLINQGIALVHWE